MVLGAWTLERTICLLIIWNVTDVFFWRGSVSRPLLRLMYGEYWFRLSRLSMMVIGSFASYTKTKLVESAVWCLLTLDDGVEQVVVNRYLMYCRLLVTGNAGSKYLNRVQGQNCSFSLFQTTIKTKLKWKWNKMNNQTTNKTTDE